LYEIAIINPRPGKTKSGTRRKSRRSGKTGAKSMAKRKRRKMTAKQKKYFGKRRAKRAAPAAAAPKRRKRRAAGGKRRPAVGYVQGAKRIRRRKLNPRAGRRSRRRSNPRFNLSGITSQLLPAAYGAGGALALDLALGYLPLPAMLKTGYARHATRIVGALGIGWLAGKFLRGKAAAVGQGALTVAMYGLLKDVAVQFAPAAISSKLGEYEEITVAGYDDPAALYGPGAGAYMNGDEMDPGTGAYMNGDVPDFATAGMDY
jgi:hypothetical protein